MSNSRQLGKSFKYALRGLVYVFKAEQNFRIQILIALLTVGAIIYFPLSRSENVLLIILIIMVLTMELLNTALERFTDLLKPRLNFYVETIKDIMAAAVFLTALGASIIGLIVLWPHFVSLFH